MRIEVYPQIVGESRLVASDPNYFGSRFPDILSQDTELWGAHENPRGAAFDLLNGDAESVACGHALDSDGASGWVHTLHRDVLEQLLGRLDEAGETIRKLNHDPLSLPNRVRRLVLVREDLDDLLRTEPLHTITCWRVQR